MSSWKGKARGGVLGHKIFVFTIKYLGVRAAYFILYFVALYFFLFSSQSNSAIYKYLRKIGKSRLKSFFSVYLNYLVFGKILIDKVAILSGFRSRYSFTLEGEHNLKDVVKNGKGGILLSAHIGNWEMAGNIMDDIGTDINILLFDNEEKNLKEYMNNVQKDRSFKIIPIGNDMSHLIRMNKALKNNELICTHADRYMEGARTFEREFLGEKAIFPAGPFNLVTKFRVPCSLVFAFKEKGFHYHFYGTKGKMYDDPEELLKDYVSFMEKMVKKYPLQWFNYYDFWTKPS